MIKGPMHPGDRALDSANVPWQVVIYHDDSVDLVGDSNVKKTIKVNDFRSTFTRDLDPKP